MCWKAWTQWEQASAPFRARVTNKIWLKDVDKAIRSYHLAGRRIDNVRRLRSAVGAWFADSQGLPPDPQMDPVRNALGKLVKKKWHELTSKERCYQQAVCIAYETKLGAADGGYLGDANDDAGDLDARWTQMQKAIDIAYREYTLKEKHSGQVVPDHQKLKIFMAPEFYFRGGSGSYGIELWFEFLEKIPEYTRRAEYRDWLFVLGTFVCNAKEERHDKRLAATLENYALVQKGGYVGRDNIHDVQVAKEFPSHIDFEKPPSSGMAKWYRPGREAKIGGKRTRGLSPPGSREFDPALKSGPQAPHLGNLAEAVESGAMAEEDETAAFGCIFSMDGLIYGLEVCRDHFQGRLVSAKDVRGVKIHLIPSCGASICDGENGGSDNRLPRTIIFNVDAITGKSDVRAPDGARGKKFFTASVPQNRTYFPGHGLIRGYQAIDIPT